MAGVASVLAAWAWWAVWRHLAPLTAHTAETGRDTRMLVLAPSLVIIAYGLDAAGFVPHTLFWMDYIARELGRGLAAGSWYWVIFGLGVVCGPFVASALARRPGFSAAPAPAFGVKAVAVGLRVYSSAPLALAVSSFLVGLLIPVVVTLTSGAVAALTTPARQQQFWGWATLSFALLLAIAVYRMSWAYGPLGSYRPLFAAAFAALWPVWPLHSRRVPRIRARPTDMQALSACAGGLSAWVCVCWA